MANDLEISSWHHWEEAEYHSLAQMLDLFADKICSRMEALSEKRTKPIRKQIPSAKEDLVPKIEAGILTALSSGEKSKEELYRFFNGHIKASVLNNALATLIESGKIVMEKDKAAGGGKRPKREFRL